MVSSSDTIPQEIWLQIIEWVPSNRPPAPRGNSDNTTTLKQLALVPSSFRPIVQSVLFKSLSINMLNRDMEDVQNRLRGLHELLRTRPESVHWVKAFNCNDWIPSFKPGDTAKENLHYLVNSLLHQLPALTSITISGVPITFQTVSDIHRLQNLRFVHLDTRRLAIQGEAWDENAGQVLAPISELFLKGEDFHPAFAGLVSAPGIHTLSLAGPGSVQFMIDVAQGHPSFDFPNLSSLTLLFDPALGRFFDFPNLCPNLTSFSIYPSIRGWETIPSPPLSALRKLRHFGGSLELVASFLPGRPIDDLLITATGSPYDLSLEMLSSLYVVSAKFRKLSVNGCYWRGGCLADIGGLFPGLEE